MSRDDANRYRWQAWRKAVENGEDRAIAYDYFLHPRTRVELAIVIDELENR